MGRITRFALLTGLAALGIALSASAAPAAISNLTVNPKAQLSSDHRTAFVTGTVTCDAGDFVFVNDELFQTQGRGFADVSGGTTVLCDGAPDTYTIPTSRFGVTWLPGLVAATVVTFDQTDFSGIGVHSKIILSP